MPFRTINRNSFAIVALAAVILAAVFVPTPLFATPNAVRVLGPGSVDDQPILRVTEQTDQGLTVELTLPTLLAEQIEIDGETYENLAIPGGADAGDIGEPLLPTYARFVAIPERAGVTVTAFVEEEEELSGILPIPMQDETSPGFAIRRDAYRRNDYGAGPVAHVGAPALLRGLRVVPVTFAPVRCNPAEQKIRVARKMRVEIAFTGEDPRNQATAPAPNLTPSFDRMYRDLVLNYDGQAKGQGLVHGTWLLICKNDTQVLTHLQPLIDWRQRKGYPVRVATTAETGTTTTTIKAYIQNAYNTWDLPPEYIVLAGDATGTYSLPTFTSGGGPGDHPYAQLSGGDLLADAHIGRLSFESLSELDIIVNKTVGYESTPYMANTAWYERACLVGDPSSSGYSTVQVMQWVKQRLLQVGYTDVDTIYSGGFVSQMSAALNQGDTFFAYRGYYGMSGWTNSNTYALTNFYKLSFGVMSTCGTGSFSSETSRSEAFLRANNTNNGPIGSVAAIGTATLSTHTRYNNCYTFGVFLAELYEGEYEAGVAHSYGKANLFLNYAEADIYGATNFSYWNNLMGDPACEIFTGIPQPIAATHPATLAVGANAVTVGVTEGGQACPGALVCLYQTSGGSGDLFATGTTDEMGQVELAIPTAWAGTMKITVTKHNAIPYLANITVGTANLHLGYQAATIDDDLTGASQGNADGEINPTETIELALQLKNFGTQTASGVQAALSSDDPYVTVLTDSQSFGTIAGGASAWSAGAYTFVLAPGCPHEHVARFRLHATAGADAWDSVIELPVVSAKFTFGIAHYTNAGGNGLPDPGETFGLSVQVRNDGQLAAESPLATLNSLSEYVDVPDGAGTYPMIPPGAGQENVGNTFTVHAHADCPNGYRAQMKMVMQFTGAMSDTVIFELPIGTRIASDPIGPDSYGYWAYDNTDTAYPEAPAYAWVEIDPNQGGPGTQVTLGDYGDYQDKSRTVNLPFPFTYYGQTFTTATICSNGWIQMGNTWMTDYRNWTLPSPGGPDGCIAAFWDDLIEVSSGSVGHVYQWHDEANHRWIVEWSRMKNIVGGHIETFQAILEDPAFHPTDTGDGAITFQYATITITDSTDGYCTVGVENPDNSIGLTYTYYNRYPAGAATLVGGTAIRFVPKREVLQGTIHGLVTNADDDNAPIGHATVTILENGHEYPTDGSGAYSGSESAGLYTVVASRSGFAPDTAQAVAVAIGGSTQVDFALQDIAPPVVSYFLQPVSTSDSTAVQVVEVKAADASTLEELTLYYRIYDGPFTTLPLGLGGSPNHYRAEIPAQPWTTRIDYYVLVRDSGDNVTLLPAGAPGDLRTFWVGPLETAYLTDFEAAAGWSVGSPEDDAASGIWIQLDPNATYHNGSVMVQPEDDHTGAPGVNCWVTGNAAAGAGEDVADVDGGLTTLLSPSLDLAIDGTVLLRYWRWFSNDTGGGAVDDPWLVEISNDDGGSWTTLENTLTSDRSWQQLEFDLNEVLPLTNQMRVRFRAADVGTASIVEAAIDDLEIVYIGLTPSSVDGPTATRFGFGAASANPARPGSVVHFGLTAAGPASLTVYDVLGRAVRRLTEGPLPAGSHQVSWDGRDDRGSLLPSGVYFYRLEAAEGARHRKVLFVR